MNFDKKSFKKMIWFWALALFLLGWQVYNNIRGAEMFKDNAPTEWNANGPGYHK